MKSTVKADRVRTGRGKKEKKREIALEPSTVEKKGRGARRDNMGPGVPVSFRRRCATSGCKSTKELKK
jgi:hypothetical protein